MAEEVEIIGVAGGPASESTLEELVQLTKKIADGKDTSSKVQDLYSKALRELTKVSRRHTQSMEDNADEFDNLSMSMRSFAGKILSGLVSAGASVIMTMYDFGKVMLTANSTLTDFAKQIPIIGSALGALVGVFDETYDILRDVSHSGAAFNNDLTNLRDAAARSRLTLEEFAGMVAENSSKLAALADTATKGAVSIGKLNDALGTQREELLSMGMSFKDINDALVDYVYMTRYQGTIDRRNANEVASAAAEYSKTLMTLSKLTGEEASAIKEKQMQQNNDLMFQMKMAKLTNKEQEKVQIALAQAALQGPTAVARFKEEFLGFPPMTEATQMFAATMSDANNSIKTSIDLTKNANMNVAEFSKENMKLQAEALSSMLETAESNSNVITAGMLQGGGPGAVMAEILEGVGIDLSKFLNMDRTERVNALMKAMEDAKTESESRDKAVQGLTKFRDTVNDLVSTFQTQVISPLLDVIGPGLLEVSTMIKEFLADGKVKEYMMEFKKSIEQMVVDFKTMNFSDVIDKWQKRFINADIWKDIAKVLDKINLNPIVIGLTNLFERIFNSIPWNDIVTKALNGSSVILDEATGGALGMGGSARQARDIATRLRDNPSSVGQEERDQLTSFLREEARKKSINEGGATGFLSKVEKYSGLGALGDALEDMMGSSVSDEDLIKAFQELEGFSGSTNEDLIKAIKELENFSGGTKGFKDFGKGTLAMLHGREAVIPMDSDIGKFIANLETMKIEAPTVPFSDKFRDMANIMNPDIGKFIANLETMKIEAPTVPFSDKFRDMANIMNQNSQSDRDMNNVRNNTDDQTVLVLTERLDQLNILMKELISVAKGTRKDTNDKQDTIGMAISTLVSTATDGLKVNKDMKDSLTKIRGVVY